MTDKIQDLKKMAIMELKRLQTSDDTEVAHGSADDVLCNLLHELGFGEVVNEYYQIEKWYA